LSIFAALKCLKLRRFGRDRPVPRRLANKKK
jgi:hypothetical protein